MLQNYKTKQTPASPFIFPSKPSSEVISAVTVEVRVKVKVVIIIVEVLI